MGGTAHATRCASSYQMRSISRCEAEFLAWLSDFGGHNGFACERPAIQAFE